MPPWYLQICAIQKKESKTYSSKWVQLATVGVDNTPRVRTVVLRGWSKSYEMEIFTDKRSQKLYELNMNNNVEVCWLFASSKCQFRFRGKSKLDLDNDKHHHWEKLSEKSKLMWSWPKPGDHYNFSRNNNLVEKTDEDHLMNFSVLKIDITHVDQLLLHKPIHIRRRWIRKNEWIEERINP